MRIHRVFTTFIALVGAGFCLSGCSGQYKISDYEAVETIPRITPDYTNLVIPPNIAPMNFVIDEPGEKFLVKIYADSNDMITIRSGSPNVRIPLKPWQKMLAANKGKEIFVQVYARSADKNWRKYQPIVNQVAEEPIDSYLVYRYLRPNYTVQKEMNIRQRHLETYDEKLVMTTKTIAACINCHNFKQNDPSNMLFHIRWGEAAGTILAQNGKLVKIDTRTEFNQAPGAYPSWHPNGKLVVFSVNKVMQFFHATDESRDVVDLSSDLILFKTESNTVAIDSAISSPRFMETFPAWSPDGKYLYFCRAPQLPPDFSLQEEYDEIKYDLVRAAYDAQTGAWGEPEILIAAATTNKSCSHPRISPDGKYLLFCMADYGNFPIFHRSADLYMLALETKEFRRLDINSDAPEGYHSWASNSRWFTFTSKRDNGVFTRLYFSYVDEQGKAHKPFVLPRENPAEYEGIFMSFSIPELITRPVPWRAQEFIDVATDAWRLRQATLDSGATLPPAAPIDSSHTVTDYP